MLPLGKYTSSEGKAWSWFILREKEVEFEDLQAGRPITFPRGEQGPLSCGVEWETDMVRRLALGKLKYEGPEV